MGLYNGMAWPWGNSLASYFNVKSDRDILRTSILNILFTRIKERVMVAGFGSPLPETPFEPSDETLDLQLAQIVRNNVQTWDARLEVLDVKVVTGEDDSVKTILVVYRDKALPNVEDRFLFSVPSDVVSRL